MPPDSTSSLAVATRAGWNNPVRRDTQQSPQSKDGSDRLEEKVDLILQAVDKDAKKEIARLDQVYHRD
jgi:hypothetical protein